MGGDGALENVVEEIERVILQIGWFGQRQFMQLLADEQFELTVPQYHTLAHLARCPHECKMSELAKATHQSAASLTGVVDRLLEKQLVARTRLEEDRRQVMVAITERGRELLVGIRQARYAEMRAALRAMDGAETYELLRLLNALLASMGRHAEAYVQRRES